MITRLRSSPRLLKWLGRMFACFVALLVLDLISQDIFPAGLETKSVQEADALLFTFPGFSDDLPDKVEITIDGVHAIFRRGEKSYDRLVNLLHNGRSQEMLEATGGSISLGGTICGDLAVRNYGITSRFRIGRSAENKDLYWILLPHLHRSGFPIPFFTAAPRVIDLIKTTGTAQKP